MSEYHVPRPEFAELAPHALVKLLPGLVPSKLRDAVLAEPRMHSHLACSLVPSETPFSLSPERELNLTTLLTQDRKTFAVQLGATYFANHLAVAVARREFLASPEGLTRDVIRIALQHRNLALPMAADDPIPTRDTLQAEGQLCLWTWLYTLPTELAEALSYRFDAPTAAAKPASITRRKRIVTKVLTAMAETKNPVEAT